MQVLFEPGTDIFQARQIVSERVAVEAAQLPKVARPPHVMPILSLVMTPEVVEGLGDAGNGLIVVGPTMSPTDVLIDPRSNLVVSKSLARDVAGSKRPR